MKNEDIAALEQLQGFLGACIVDADSGMMMVSLGGSSLDLEVAAAANTEVVKAKQRAIRELGLDDSIEDILITLGGQYHLIRPLGISPMVFIYLALDRENSNLALARRALKTAEQSVTM
ncbi:hypothetical protein [Roseobacter sp. HKCCA0434]|uniref:hypothetical protein n=1 Tax=Roseobacter sp. HKCCA0434 TaxID=3079297 RepID=UPI002905F31B|nr:hypothetical protein [Roseobacter sp. HKCCA0434]